MPYQPAHAVRLVHLVWRRRLLPRLTKVPIWVRACRVVPLPMITTAARGQGIDVSVEGGVVGWVSVAIVM